jgi:hypothetical protein
MNAIVSIAAVVAAIGLPFGFGAGLHALLRRQQRKG